MPQNYGCILCEICRCEWTKQFRWIAIVEGTMLDCIMLISDSHYYFFFFAFARYEILYKKQMSPRKLEWSHPTESSYTNYCIAASTIIFPSESSLLRINLNCLTNLNVGDVFLLNCICKLHYNDFISALFADPVISVR